MINLKDEANVQIWCDFQEEIQQTNASFFLRLRFANFNIFLLNVSNYGYDNGHGDGDGYGWTTGNGSGNGYEWSDGYGFGENYGYGDGNGTGDCRGFSWGYGSGNVFGDSESI